MTGRHTLHGGRHRPRTGAATVRAITSRAPIKGDWFDPAVREAVNRAARAQGVCEPFRLRRHERDSEQTAPQPDSTYVAR
ncbi:hypothetical protein [Sciscionella sediminilitoris]|uniref:hypothetical protein n=1 Tax=Sciscionella sediminilitoris TaxID=1445613 RepID=UPI0004DF716B|nr:hypothetical protein [Sciscionella sp. SE31]